MAKKKIKPTIIHNMDELATALNARNTVAAIVYKLNKYVSAFGIFVTVIDDGFRLMAPIQGLTYGTGEYTITFPFPLGQLTATIAYIREEHEIIWMNTHGCSRCETPHNDKGHGRPVNKKCKICKGRGSPL